VGPSNVRAHHRDDALKLPPARTVRSRTAKERGKMSVVPRDELAPRPIHGEYRKRGDKID